MTHNVKVFKFIECKIVLSGFYVTCSSAFNAVGRSSGSFC